MTLIITIKLKRKTLCHIFDRKYTLFVNCLVMIVN